MKTTNESKTKLLYGRLESTNQPSYAPYLNGLFSQLSRVGKATTPLLIATSALLISIIMVACAGSVNVKHPAMQDITPDTPVAKIYFIRPRMLKPKGVSDNVLSISMDKIKILDIHAGAYTLITVKPGKSVVATHSLTTFTNKKVPIEVTRFREYNFVAGKTYFIHIDRVNEEFRGVFFDPKPIDLKTAKTLLNASSPFGAAKRAPISDLESVDEAPLAGEMPPVAPEQLYPDQKYLLTPHPFKR